MKCSKCYMPVLDSGLDRCFCEVVKRIDEVIQAQIINRYIRLIGENKYSFETPRCPYREFSSSPEYRFVLEGEVIKETDEMNFVGGDIWWLVRPPIVGKSLVQEYTFLIRRRL